MVKPKIKRDKYAGLTRKQKRARQRDELFAKDEEEAVETGGSFRVSAQKAYPYPDPPNPNPASNPNPTALILTLTPTLEP